MHLLLKTNKTTNMKRKQLDNGSSPDEKRQKLYLTSQDEEEVYPDTDETLQDTDETLQDAYADTDETDQDAAKLHEARLYENAWCYVRQLGNKLLEICDQLVDERPYYLETTVADQILAYIRELVSVYVSELVDTAKNLVDQEHPAVNDELSKLVANYETQLRLNFPDYVARSVAEYTAYLRVHPVAKLISFSEREEERRRIQHDEDETELSDYEYSKYLDEQNDTHLSASFFAKLETRLSCT
jgi:hypothetical protein